MQLVENRQINHSGPFRQTRKMVAVTNSTDNIQHILANITLFPADGVAV
jgi:hypothetical protein